jgi:hypothetical protein
MQHIYGRTVTRAVKYPLYYVRLVQTSQHYHNIIQKYTVRTIT